MTTYRYIAPCHFGLEKTLSFEVKRLGAQDVTVTDGNVAFSGDAALCARANVFLSTAERVCIVLGQFRAATFDELFEGVRALPLEEYIGKNDAFPNTGYSLNSKLTSIPACQRSIKKAMALRLSAAYKTDFLPETGARCQIRFSLMKDVCTIMLDASGEGLHKRGYRRESNAAPIKETLAAGIIDLARVRAGEFICDPFCGSGTLLIESAYKALGIAAGMRRRFAGESFGFLPEKLWRDARAEAADAIKRDADFCCVGFDIDPECTALTLANAKKAGVEKYVRAETRAIKDFAPLERAAKFITNPPYGERLLEKEQAQEIYRTMGKKLLPLGENKLFVITPDETFEELFGCKADKNRKLYNGMMMCRLYSYFKNEN